MERSRTAAIVSGLISLTVVAVGCGNGRTTQSPTATVMAAPDQALSVEAKNVRYQPDNLTVRLNSTVELSLRNADATEHDFQADGLETEVISEPAMHGEHGAAHEGASMTGIHLHTMANETSSIVFKPTKKGTYDFYCTIPGHKEAGMVGRIIVE